MPIKNNVSLFILIVFISYSCNDQSPTDLNDSKKEYPFVRAGSDGINWEELINFPTIIGQSAVRSIDITVDEIGNLYLTTTSDGLKIIDRADTTVKTIYYNFPNSNNSPFHAILYSDGILISGLTNLIDKAGIFISEDHGNTFQSRIIWDKYSIVNSLYEGLNGKIFAGCYYEIFISSDGGYTWENQTQSVQGEFVYFYSFAFNKFSDVYGATRKGVYFCDVKKKNFYCVGLSNEVILSVASNSKDWIYATTENKSIYLSTNSGLNWEQLINYPSKQSYSLYINDNDYLIAGTEDGIYRSTDYGNTWDQVGLGNKYIIKIISDLSGNLIAATYMNEIYISQNN